MLGLKLFVFVIFFFGNIVFMSYRASLTSELSVTRETLPFDSVPGMYEAEYRVVTHWRYLLRMFSDKDAFDRHSERGLVVDTRNLTLLVQMARNDPRTAFATMYETVMSYDDNECVYKVAYKTKFPLHLSFGFPKESVYLPFFKYHIIRYIEQGTITKLLSAAVNDKTVCLADIKAEDRALSIFKVFSLFLVFGSGVVLSIGVFLYESCGRRKEHSKRRSVAVELRGNFNTVYSKKTNDRDSHLWYREGTV